ncbi:hypothetical protein VNO77_39982 [Canavalia gladiata]|uniref:Uncharacterized protein n=1 Tax=Canavalia gladiata TaxID=3824 RepID=A0AAN9PQW9_CANGL
MDFSLGTYFDNVDYKLNGLCVYSDGSRHRLCLDWWKMTKWDKMEGNFNMFHFLYKALLLLRMCFDRRKEEKRSRCIAPQTYSTIQANNNVETITQVLCIQDKQYSFTRIIIILKVMKSISMGSL